MKIILINTRTRARLLLYLISLMVGNGVFFLFFTGYGRAWPAGKDRNFLLRRTGVWEIKTGEKLLALTFDGGPDPVSTGRILDLLKQYNVKATFFVTGGRAELYPEVLLRQVREGHELGNHNYTRRAVDRISEEELRLDLYRTHRAIQEITGENMRLFRPAGKFGARTRAGKKILRVAKALGYEVILRSREEESRDRPLAGGEEIARQLLKNTRPGDIISFPDREDACSNTLQALRLLLPVLKERGYRFVTVSELLRAARGMPVTDSHPLTAAHGGY
ncbi:MAG: polysaccharide deacetylase family protein [Firmicutes bacterium]|nr:polysaccharide deacetylase family protein [Bacillota bacterium]